MKRRQFLDAALLAIASVLTSKTLPLNAANRNRMYLASRQNNLYASDDNGASWSKCADVVRPEFSGSSGIVTDAPITGIACCGSVVIAVSSYSAAYDRYGRRTLAVSISRDNGVNFVPFEYNDGLQENPHVGLNDIVFSETLESFVAGGSYGRIYLANKQGYNWRPVSGYLLDNNNSEENYLHINQIVDTSHAVLALMSSSTRSNAGDNVLFSEDTPSIKRSIDGTNWETVLRGGYWVRAGAKSSTNIVCIGLDTRRMDTLLFTADLSAANWQITNLSAVIGHRINLKTIVSYSQGFLAAGDGANMLYITPDGQNWQLIDAPFRGIGAITASCSTDEDIIFMGTDRGELVISTNNLEWQLADTQFEYVNKIIT